MINGNRDYIDNETEAAIPFLDATVGEKIISMERLGDDRMLVLTNTGRLIVMQRHLGDKFSWSSAKFITYQEMEVVDEE